MDRFLLLCGGPGSRWDNFLGITKHLIKINGETLIERNSRLFQPITVGPYPNATRPLRVKLPESKFLDTEHLWARQGHTVFLFGDVYFSEEAATMINSTFKSNNWTFYGRSSASGVTGHSTGEMFAVSIHADQLDHFSVCVKQAAATKTRKVFKEGCANGLGWLTYYLMCGQPTQPKWRNYGNMVEINDFTDDFDTPEQYESWLDAFQRHQGLVRP